MTTRVKIIKASPGSLVFDVNKFVLPLANIHLERAANFTVQEMQDQITASIQRPGSTGNLANSIFSERISDKSIGVGKISFLDENAKYWKAINYGSSHMVGRRMPFGTFAPGLATPDAGSFRTGRFYAGQSQGGSMYSPVVKRPIQAHNYIERTQAQLPNIVERAMK